MPTFASGPYAATYNTDNAPGSPPGKGEGERNLGLVEGVRLWQRKLDVKPITSSAYGSTVIDAVYQGGQCYCRMTFKEWTPAVRDCLWPFGESFGETGPPGRLLTSLAGELKLTAKTDTSAATNGPATITFGKAILDGETVEIPLGETERDIAATFRCFPYVNVLGKIVWFEIG